MREFFQAFAQQARIGLHIDSLQGVNSHHIAESAFKGFARAFGKAVALDPRRGRARCLPPRARSRPERPAR